MRRRRRGGVADEASLVVVVRDTVALIGCPLSPGVVSYRR
jgi:hypothetical protein